MHNIPPLLPIRLLVALRYATLFLATLFVAHMLAGCRPPDPNRTPLEDRAVAVTIEALRETGHKIGNCPIARMKVVKTQTAEAFDSYCCLSDQDTPEQCVAAAASCLSTYRSPPSAVLRPGQVVEPDGEPVIHEALHLYVLCDEYVSADANHERRDIWRKWGPDTVQARANRKITDPGASTGAISTSL